MAQREFYKMGMWEVRTQTEKVKIDRTVDFFLSYDLLNERWYWTKVKSYEVCSFKMNQLVIIY